MKKEFHSLRGSWLCIAAFIPLLLQSITSSAQLKGNYTINASSSASSTNYLTFSSAVSDLTSGTRSDGGTANGKGVAGSVVFKVSNGNYNEQISIGAISGISSTNTITFQSTSGDSSKVLLYYASSSSATNNYTLYLHKAKYLTFKQMTIQRTGTAAYANDILMDSGSRNISFLGNLLWGKLDPSTTTIGIAAGNPVVYSTGTDSFNTYNGNRFRNGYNGIVGTGSYGYNNVISNNIFDTCGMAGIYINGTQKNLLISSNTFNQGVFNVTGVSHYLSYGVRLENSTDFKIVKNKFYATSNASVSRCIVMFYGNSSTGNRSLLANNWAWVSAGSTSSTGITLGGNTNLDVVYNNVLMTSTPSSSAALYVYPQYTGSSNVVENNNLINKGTGTAVDNSNNPSSSGYSTGVTVERYNNLYTKGTYIGNYQGTKYTTLANWQATTLDSYAVNVDPGYVSSTDLHVSSAAINNKGIPFAAVTDDIDGNSRSISTPDIGACEFTPNTLDAGVTNLDSPTVYCAGTKNIVIRFTNFGKDTLKSVTVNWSVNGVAQTGYSWTGALPIANISSQINLGSLTLASNTPYTLKIWTTNPNGSTDQKNTNDTIVKTINSGMSGNYTLGGSSPDFASFNDALNAVTLRGLCGATVFKVRNGTYTEQVSVPTFASSNSSNTITFQSESGDSSKVTLTYGASNANGTNNVTLQMNGARYVTFRNMTISRNGSGIYQSVVELKGGANNNSFLNNRLIGILISSSATTSDVVTSAADKDSANTFRNNLIRLGNDGINISGDAANHETFNIIDGNTIDSSFATPINAIYNDGITVKNNKITNASYSSTTNYGIALNTCNKAISVTANKVQMGNGGYAGIFISSCTSVSGSEGLIANNYVSIACNSTTPYGLYNSSSTYQNYYFNTVDVYKSNTSSAAFYSNASGNVNVKNNILYNNGTGYSIYASSSSAISGSNYNDLYTKGTNLGNWAGSNESNLSAWQTASSMDAKSISTEPYLAANADYHTKNPLLTGAATPITGISKDIDGNTRNSSTPTIGALEFKPYVNEASLTAVTTPTASICAGKSNVIVTLKNTGGSTITKATINWSVNGTAQTAYSYTGTLASGSTASVTIGTYTFTSGTANIIAYVSSPNGVSDSFSINDTTKLNVTVTTPKANVGSASAICAGNSATIGTTAVTGDTYSWTSRPSGYTSNKASNSVSPSATTTYILTESTSNGCSTTDSVIVTVNPLPTPKAGTTSTICAGQSTSIGGKAVTGETYSWTSRPSGFTSSTYSNTVNPTVSTTYILKETNTYGCSAIDSVIIKVNPLPTVPVGSPQTICAGSKVTVGATTVSGNTYSWTSNPSGFTSSSANPTFAPKASTYFVLSVTNSNGCTNKDSVKITVNPLPAGKTGPASTICAGNTVTLGATALSGNTYGWTSFPTGYSSTKASPTVSPATSTIYILTETISATGCSLTDSVSITVNPLPKIANDTSISICAGQSVQLGLSGASGTKYSWASKPTGYSSSVANPLVTPSSNITYILTATSSSGCTAMDSAVITVNPLPQAIVGSNQTICNGEVLRLGSKAVFGNTYSWTSKPSGFTSTSSSPVITATATTTYFLTETDGITNCSKTDSVIITVAPKPTAPSISGSNSVCSGSTSIFKPASTSTGISYTFQLGTSGSTGTKLLHSTDSAVITWGTASSIDLWLVTKNSAGCKDSSKLSITINANPKAAFSAGAVCIGSATKFNNTSTGSIIARWSFGDGDTLTAYSPSHNYKTTGSFKAILLVANTSGCYDTVSKMVQVNALPTVAFSATTACVGNATTFTNTSAATSYKWEFGDGNTSTATAPTHAYTVAGKYTVVLIATNASGCTDSSVKTVTVSPLPSAGFSAKQGMLRSFSFTANDATQTGYSWDFGDSTATATGATTPHSFAHPGTYHIKLTVTSSGGCSSTLDSAFVVKTSGINTPTTVDLNLDIYPNPFNSTTTLSYNLIEKADVRIELMDMTGRQIMEIANTSQASGNYTYTIDAASHNLKAGVYLVNFLINGNPTTKRIIKVN